jgi:hypothetical protein
LEPNKLLGKILELIYVKKKENEDDLGDDRQFKTLINDGDTINSERKGIS